MTTDVLSLDTVQLTDADVLYRDVHFPISDLRRYSPADAVMDNFPVYLGRWENGTTVPAIKTQTIGIDTTMIVDECDVAEVDSAMTSCDFIAPNQKKIKMGTKTLELTSLIPLFAKQRNLTTAQLGNLLTPSNGRMVIDAGNPYAINFMRFAMAAVYMAYSQTLSYSALRGDYANQFQVDGFYTQLDDGWADGDVACGDENNIAQTINWAVLCGKDANAVAGPDEVTVAGQTVTLWGETYDVPADLNFAEFLEELWIIKVEQNYVSGGVDVWEMHIEHGKGRGFLKTAACMQPCNLNGEFDQTLRERYRRLVNGQVGELYPSNQTFALLESQHVGANTLYFGPRQIAGRPTYGLAFWDMNDYFNSLGAIGTTPVRQYGMPESDTLLAETHSTIRNNFESVALQQFFTTVGDAQDCAKGTIMAYYGVLATARHLWLKVTNISSTTWVKALVSNVEIDGTDLHS